MKTKYKNIDSNLLSISIDVLALFTRMKKEILVFSEIQNLDWVTVKLESMKKEIFFCYASKKKTRLCP